jgi:hypothetical protein
VGTGSRFLALCAVLTGIAALSAPVAYVLWPRWPEPIAVDAPSMPIIIGGVTFNVPPAAIRVAMQRRPGTQSRIDLIFVWPSLAPPDPAVKGTPAAPINLNDRIFITIAGADSTLPPIERLKTIYPRYTTVGHTSDQDGLKVQGFRANTPYQGEDLVYDPASPARFLLRCTRNAGATPGMCLHERRLGTADVTVRFPRDWLNDWPNVAAGIDKLIFSMRPTEN